MLSSMPEHQGEAVIAEDRDCQKFDYERFMQRIMGEEGAAGTGASAAASRPTSISSPAKGQPPASPMKGGMGLINGGLR